MIKGIAAFITGIVGYAAGISILFYAFGYLITLAHLNLLGISRLVDYDNEHFLREGAIFFVDIGYWIIRTSLTFLTAGVFILLFILPITFYFSKSSWLGTLREKTTDKFVRLSGNILLKVSLYLLLFLAFIWWHSDAYLYEYDYPLHISNLLYGGTIDSESMNPDDKIKIKEIVTWLFDGDMVRLKKYFDNLLFGEVLAALLLLFTWRLTSDWRLRVLWMSPFVIGFIVYTVSLPYVYGVLRHPINYPLVTICWSDEKSVQSSETFFLLNKTDNEFILWDFSHKKVLWIPTGAAKQVEITGIENLFSKKPKPL